MKISKFQYSFFWTTNAQLEKSPLNNRKVFRGSVRNPEFDNSIFPISLRRAVSRSISKLTSDLNFVIESYIAPLEAHERLSAAAESSLR
jgi:hypothetical protein